MKVTMVYIFPHGQEPGKPLPSDYAARFVASYIQYPPGFPHKTIMVSNGAPATARMRSLFDLIDPATEVFVHDNTGWDIGAHIAVAKTVQSDILLCFGQAVYFHRAGWLNRIVEMWLKHGHGSYSGTASHASTPHLQTSGFWAPPWLIAEHPVQVTGRGERYDFEHGPNAFWRRGVQKGLPALLVCWDGVYPMGHWRDAADIFWRGDQTNCLYWTNHTDVYLNTPSRRLELRRIADGYGNR